MIPGTVVIYQHIREIRYC